MGHDIRVRTCKICEQVFQTVSPYALICSNACRTVAARGSWAKYKRSFPHFRKGTVLNAHHILSWATYSSERYNVDNGISLCKDCHMETHRKHQPGLHGSFTSEAG